MYYNMMIIYSYKYSKLFFLIINYTYNINNDVLGKHIDKISNIIFLSFKSPNWLFQVVFLVCYN